MPVVADSFRRIRLVDVTTPEGPLDIQIVADDRNDTLNLQAGVGISLIVDPETDSIVIYNTGSPIGIANLDDILQVGNTSSLGIDVGSVKVDSLTIDNNIISTTLANNITLKPGPTGLLLVDSTTAVRLPVGAESQRPSVGVNPGYIRFNLDRFRFEGFNGSTWSSLGGVTSDDGETTIEPGVDGSTPILIFRASNETVATFSAINNKFYSPGLQIPVGDTSERPSPSLEGQIRFNDEIGQFEGYNGIGWSSLGGVRDIDGNTYIIPELNPGDNDNTLYFVANGGTSFTIDSQRLVIKNARPLRFEEPIASGNNYAELASPDVIDTSYTIKLPRSIGTNGDLLGLNALGELEFVPADSFAGGRVIVSADFGDDTNDGINKPVATIKRALQIASGFVYDVNGIPNGKKLVINVAAGDYVEDNPIIIPDNVSVLGAGLRACNVRPANANKDFLRVRNACYFGEFTFRDFVDANQVPVHTFDYAVAFDDPTDVNVSRTGYTNLPTTKPIISVSPYIQNVSILSFLGGNGVIVDGNLVQTPNTPLIQATVERPVDGPAPEQGKSMVANAFTMLSFGGTGWRIINDAYAQIVSCFQIFMLNGSYCQSGGYLSITNSATNFGIYALRASGFSRNAFQFDKGIVADTGTSNSQQTITAVGFGRLPTQDFVLRFRNPAYRVAYDLLLANKASIQAATIAWITDQITNEIPPFTSTFTYNQSKCSRDVGLIIEAVALDVLTGGNAKSVEAGLSYYQAQSAILNSQEDQNIAAFTYVKTLAQTAVTSTGLSSYVGGKFDIVINAIDDPQSAPTPVGFSNDGDITSSFKPASTEVTFNAATVNPTTNVINIPTHGFTNGESIIYDNGGNLDIPGLDNEQTYYVILLDSSNFRLAFDEGLTVEVDILGTGTGTHKFIKNLQEFFIDDLVSSHNSYQELTLAPGTYTFTPGKQITGVSGLTVNSAYVHSYDPVNRKLKVSVNLVAIGQSSIRNPFIVGSTIDADNGSPAVTNIAVTAVAGISNLYTATFRISSTSAEAELVNLVNLPTKQIWLHRPSIVNSSGHTWEYAGSGIDYNALPQNGGQSVEAYEQYADLPGRVYSSGTNELGDFKVGNFIKAENKTGNVSFTNTVSVAQLDALRLAVGDVVIEFISDDIGLGDNEPGGASDSRLSTQKAIRSFLANRLGGFIDKAVSTNAVPGAVIQLNSSGQINPDLLPAVRTFNSAKSEGFNSRLLLVEEVPAFDFLNGDIVSEEYSTVQLTLDKAVTANLGELVVQANTNARGYLVSDVSASTVITVASEGLTFTNNFNIIDTISINGDSTPSDSNQTVVPTIVGTIATDVTGNYVLSNANQSQYLVLAASGSYNFTGVSTVISANDYIQGSVDSTRYGVLATVDNITINGGSGYSPASGTLIYKFVPLTGGSGTGAIADITVTNGIVTSVDLRRGGENYLVTDVLSAAAADLGGGTPTSFSINVLSIEKRVYVDLIGGERFVATLASPNFIADANAQVNTISVTASTQKTFNAQDIISGGNVDYANSRITISAHGYTDGDPVKYVSTPNTAIGNLANNNVYYIKVIDSSTIELYETYNLATKITFGTSSTGTHSLTIFNFNTVNSTIYIPSHGLNTGDPLRFTGANLPNYIVGITSSQIVSGTFFFVGSKTTNSFTLHSARSEALASVNGLTISKLVLDPANPGSGNATFTKQNVTVIRTVNTSSTNLDNWSSISANTVDASSIVSGIISTSRLAGTGVANNKTFLRGDSSWSAAVQSIREVDSPVTLSGDFTTIDDINYYYANVQIDIERVSSNLGDTAFTNAGVARFNKAQFNVGSNLTAGQVTIKDGVVDAGTLDGLDSTHFLDSSNHSVQPVAKGGTGLSSYAQGDLIYASDSLTLDRLAVSNQAGAILTSSGTQPQWATNLSVPGTLTVTNTTDSTNKDTGAVIVEGGVGIEKNLNVGGSVSVGSDLTVTGSLNVVGSITTINSTVASVEDKNLELGVVSQLNNITGTISGNTVSGLPSGAITTADINKQIRKVSGAGSFGTGTIIKTVIDPTNITVENTTGSNTNGTITFNVLNSTDSSANEGGITLLGDTNKTFNWINATDSWTSSEHIELKINKSFRIDGTDVLSKTSLGTGVVSSSLTSVGTISTGTWQGSIIGATYGGTGVNNGSRTITVNTDNVTFTAQSGGSSVTVPASGTLATLAGTENLSNKTLVTPKIQDSNADASYNITVGNLAANRNIALPVLTGDDTFVFEAHSQILSNKTFNDSTTVFQDSVVTGRKFTLNASITGGTGLQLTVTTNGTGVISVTGIANSGSGYVSGDKVTVSAPGTPTTVAVYAITGVNASGAVSAGNLENAGQGYTPNLGATIASTEMTTGSPSRTFTLPRLSDTLVGTVSVDSLSNKTLILPKIGDSSNTHTYNFGVNELAADRIVTLPLLAGNDTFVFESHSQTLTNKTFVDSTTVFQDDANSVKKFKLQASSIGGSGLQLRVSTNASGIISSVSATLIAAGSNYSAGDVVTITGGGALGTPTSLATYTINTVNLSGAVLTGTLTTGGTGYAANQSNQISTTSISTADRTYTVPVFSTTLVGIDVPQTLTNKSFNDDSTEFFDNVDASKKFKFQASGIAANTTRTLTIPDKDGTIAVTTDFATLGGDGQLTLGVSGNGLTGSATFTANQTANSTFTVDSNATADNTANTIVYRGTDGNFSAGTITATAFDGKLTKTVTGTTSAELIRATMGTNDYFRIQVGSTTAADNGFVEIATADNGTEPIYVRQYEGDFATLKRTATLLGADGNTSFPGTVTATELYEGNNRVLTSYTDTNTTYSIALSDGGVAGEVDIDLTAGGSGSGTDSVTLKAGSNVTLTRTNDVVTIASSYVDTNTDTTYSIALSDGGTGEVDIDLTAGGSGSGIDSVTLKAGSNITLTRTNDVVTIASSYVDTNTDTTYSIALSDGGVAGEVDIDLTAGGSGSGIDSVTLKAGSNITLTRTNDVVTIAGANFTFTESDTLETVTGRGASSTKDISLTSTTVSTTTSTGALKVSGGVGISGNTNIGGYINVGKTLKSPYNIIAPVTDNFTGTGAMTWLDWADVNTATVVSTGTSPTGLDIHPWGTYLYVVASDADLLYQYKIDLQTGKLTPTSTPTFSTPPDPERVLVHSSGKTLYVTSSTQFSISAYTIAGETLFQQTPISLGGNPRYLVQYPFGGFLYVSCPGENIIQQISINDSGSASGSIWSTVVNGPSGLAFDPTGRFLYVASEIDNKIYQYAILNSTGQLTETPVSSVTSNGDPKNILIDPTGRFLYSTSLLDNTIRSFSIDQNTGNLTFVDNYGITNDPYALAIDPLGKNLYITSTASNLIYLRNINQKTGAISNANGGSPDINNFGYTRTFPFDIKIHPSGQFMYVTNKNSNNISEFRLSNLSAGGATLGDVTITSNVDTVSFTQGALSVAGGVGIDGRINVANSVYTNNFFQSQYPTVSPVKPYGLGTGKILESLRTIACRDNPLEIAIHPSGKFLYVANSSTQDGISQFSVNDDTGVIASLTPANVTTNSDVIQIVIHPSGRYLYATAQSEKLIYQYSIDQTTGVLTALSTATIATAGNGYRIVIDPAGVYLYVANNDLNTITAYSINNTTGQLTNLNLSIASGGNNPNDMTFDSTGRYLYVNNTNSNGFAVFNVNRKTGKLATSGGIINISGNPSDIYAEPSGRFLYVTRSSSTSIYIYKIDPVSGSLLFVNTATVINDARSVTSDPYGNCLYVCSPSTNQIQALAINPGTGELTALNTVNAPTGAFVNELAVDPKGRFLYTLNQDLDTLQQYSLDSFSYSGGSFNGQTTFNQNLIFGDLTSSEVRTNYQNVNNQKLVFRPSIDLNNSKTITVSDANDYYDMLGGLTAVNSFTNTPYIIKHADYPATGIMLSRGVLAASVGSTFPTVVITAGNSTVSSYIRVGADDSSNESFKQGILLKPNNQGVYVDGRITVKTVIENFTPLAAATGVVTHNLTDSAVWYHTGVTANFTVNFTNALDANTNKITTASLIINQGATAYIPNAVQIDGVAQTINWADNTVPTGVANRVQTFAFSLIRTNTPAWIVLGSAQAY